jgi:solute carrier family 35 (UDP-sugar transporter), member A1/2/3
MLARSRSKEIAGSTSLVGSSTAIASMSSNNLAESSGGANSNIDSKDGPEMSGTSSGETPPANAAAAAAATSMASFKLILLIGMVLQNSSTVLVGRYTRAGVPKADQYDVNHLIVVIELGKLLLSAALEFHTTHGKLVQSLQTHILDRPMDALMILVPALLYLVQNTLLYVALTNLAAPIFQVTYQAKLVTTAVVSVFMLQRSYSVQQWVCLVLLSLGVAVVVLGESSDKSPPKEGVVAQSLTLGLTAVTIACFSSALAGVYFEKVLKNPASSDATKAAPASLWMRNIQLSFFSIIIALGQGYFAKAPDVPVPYLHGFTAWAWILVLLQAGGGLLVAAVIKYADNVLKGLATGVSVVLATMVSTVLFGTPLTFQFSVGATMILGSVYYFSNPLPGFAVGSGGKKEENVEIKSLLPK